MRYCKLLILFSIFCITSFHLSELRAQSLSQGLIAHFPFEKSPSDVIGNIQGTVHGARLEDSRCGDKAYYFDGSESYIDYENSNALNGNFAGLSFGAWVKPENYYTMELSTVMAKWAFDPQNDHFGLWLNKNLKVVAAISSPHAMENGIFSNRALNSGDWHHLMVTWSRDGTIKIYIDGTLDKMGKQTGKGINTRSEAPLRIGRQVFRRSRPFKGHIDEARIYNRTLSDKEVSALYESGREVCERAIISGIVLNKKTGEPVDASVAFENMELNAEIMRLKTDGSEGTFEVKLPVGKKYGVFADAENYLSENDVIDATNLKPFSTVYKRLYVVPFEIGESLRLNNIFFDFSKASLRRESNAELNRILPYFAKYPGLKIELAGHTDSIGSDDANKVLSENRAKSVRAYLISKGIDGAKIVASGYGEAQPVATNDTDEGRQLNRRVEFKILAK
ncbi:MAG: LamG-like jellyroll fold domain-containing protein [Cyclobacteriaceae bacterium]